MNKSKKSFASICMVILINLLLILPVHALTEPYKASGDVVFMNVKIKKPFVSSILKKDDTFHVGDVIFTINGEKANKDLIEKYSNCKDIVKVKVRSENIIEVVEIEGFKLNNFLFEHEFCAIGTITAIDKNGNFIAFAHGFSIDGNQISMDLIEKADIYGTKNINYIATDKKRTNLGYINGNSNNKYIGKILKSNGYGVVGVIEGDFKSNFKENIYTDEVRAKLGKAQVLLTNPDTNQVEKYDIVVTKLFEDNFFQFKLTDKDIIKYSNGVVPGMSGSPIIQDGKVIGAISRVNIKEGLHGYAVDAIKMIELFE